MENKIEELLQQLWEDELLYGASMYHIDEDRNVERIEPYSERYWEVLNRSDEQGE